MRLLWTDKALDDLADKRTASPKNR